MEGKDEKDGKGGGSKREDGKGGDGAALGLNEKTHSLFTYSYPACCRPESCMDCAVALRTAADTPQW